MKHFHLRLEVLTLFWFWSRFASKVGFLKRPPFESFTVSATLHIPFPTLLARWLAFVAFQPFPLARDASISALALLGLCDSSILHLRRYWGVAGARERSPPSSCDGANRSGVRK